MDIKTYKQMLLNELYEPYKQCQKCPLAGLGRKNVVFGEGNPDATLMFIGEGPGQKEDELCRPFIGKSGQLLTKIIEALGSQREEVFITNVVKCRPPNNRKPFPAESEICTNLLLFRQIKIIRPTIICTLGASATETFLGKNVQITKIRGKLFDILTKNLVSDNFDKKKEILLLPTFHPAYCLRNFQKVEIFANDIKLALKISKS